MGPPVTPDGTDGGRKTGPCVECKENRARLLKQAGEITGMRAFLDRLGAAEDERAERIDRIELCLIIGLAALAAVVWVMPTDRPVIRG